MAPEGWRRARIGEIARVTSGGTPAVGRADYYGGDVPFLKIDDITQNGRLRIDQAKTSITQLALRETSAKLYPRDAVLLTMYGTIGAVAVLDRPMAANQAIGVLLDLKGALPEFMAHRLSHDAAALRGKAGHTTQSNISGQILKAHEVLLPPLPEQRKITAILSSVDETIEKTEAVIAQLDVVKKAMLEELLTHGIPGRHSRFKQTEIGDVPEEWAMKALGDFASVRGGKRMPKGRPFAPHTTPHPYIRVSDFEEGTVRMSELRYVLPEDQKEIRAYTISRDDLYISIAGTLGLVGMVPPELDGAQLTENAAKICAIEASAVHAPYLMFAFQASRCQDQLGRLKGVGAGVPKLALFRIASVQVALPSLHEQRLIAAALSSLDDRRRGERLFLQSLGRTKGALSAALLSGDLRIAVGEAE